jgi:biopolymer transport protein TolQ
MPIIRAFAESDLFGQLILLILFVLSIFAWSTILRKYLDLKQAKKNSTDYYDKYLRRRKDLRKAADIVVDEPCPFYEVAREALGNLADGDDGGMELNQRWVTEVDMEVCEASLDRCISRQTMRLEENLNLLATSASVSPFLGLLGTVWGVLVAFQDMSKQQSAQISAVTAGISGALVTTVVGLLVAIPSLVMYNYMVNNIRRFETEMENFASEILADIDSQFGKK